jgi:septal ring factor EnvC (AmiA/AmiB activator)
MTILHREEFLQKTSASRANWSSELHLQNQRIE